MWCIVALTLVEPSYYRIIDADHQRVGRWMQEHHAGYYRDGSTAIGLTRHGELVAGAMYDQYNGCSIVASIAIDGPITRQWLWYIFAYPFIQLKANVIIGLISSANLRSIKLVEKMGFQSVADIPHADPSGLLCIYTMHRDQCRFIRSPYHE
jgi:hypothetical protein